jgi:hypothetical protein
MILNSPYITGSITVTDNSVFSGSITVLGGISGSSAVSASYAVSASFASNAATATSASFASNATTATSASQAQNAVSSSYSSNADLFDGKNSTEFAITGSNIFTGIQYNTNTSNPNGFGASASIYTDGGVRITRDAYVSGTMFVNNLTVFGTQSVNYVTSSQLNISTNIISVNTDTPSIRFGGLSVYDSGSTGLTGSMLWDSERDHWVYSNPSGSSYSGGMIMSGPRSSALGSEQGTLNNYVMKGQGGDHITSSQIIDDGTTVRIPGNLQVTGSVVLSSTLTGSSALFSSTVTASNGLLMGNGGAIATTNYLSKFTGANTIGNSLFTDNGTNGALGGTNYSSGTGVRTFNITSTQYAGLAFWTDSGYTGDIFSYFSNGNMVISADPQNIMSESNLFLAVDGVNIATLNTTNATLSRALSGTSATFSSTVTANNTVSINTDVTMLRFGNQTRWGFQRPAADNRYVSFMRNMNATATPVWTVDGDNGNVGIGTTSPGNFKLYINNGSSSNKAVKVDIGYGAGSADFGGLDIFRSNTSTVGDGSSVIFSALRSDNAETEYGGYGSTIETNTAGSHAGRLQLMTSYNGITRIPRMIITGVGNVLIGKTTDDGQRLQVNGAVRTDNVGLVRAGSFRGGFYTYDAVIGSGTDYGMTIFAEGGTGNGNIYLCPGGSGTKRMTIAGSGNVIFSSQVYNNTPSSPRNLFISPDGEIGGVSSIRASKTNIESFNTDWVYDLKPVQFNYRKKDESGQYTEEFDTELFYGLIAEETELVNRELCNYNDDELIGIEYSKLVPVLVKTIQELKAENDTLKEILQRNNII